MVKIPMSIAVQNFLKDQNLEKFLSVHTSSVLSVDPSGSLSVTSSPSAQNLSKFPSNIGRNVVNYLHEILVIIPMVHTLSVKSVTAPICASSIPSINPSVNECLECLECMDEYPITNYEEKTHLKS